MDKQSDKTPHGINGENGKPAAVARPSRPRIDCVDGCRFALVFPIIVGHFIRFGTDKKWILKLLTQENVLVGGFFLISGYVTGYVTTAFGQLGHDAKKLAEPEKFFWQKVMSYYPLHFLVSTACAPMFILSERWANLSWRTTGFHAILNYTLMQAWFSSEAEIWNPPTWFLSALTFANLTMPSMVLPQVAALSKEGLRKLYYGLTAISVIQKLSYSQSWHYFCEGNFQTKIPPNRWNITRFNPVWALGEITMGVAAVRDVMLDDPALRKKPANPLWFFLASYATLALRLTRFNFNDAMVRSCVFIPLYTIFLTTLHRDSLCPTPAAITRLLGSKWMSFLGSLAFPMFILHGPIGQLFYKKKIATKLWGRVMPKQFFPVYLLIVMVTSHIVNEGFVKSPSVQRFSSRIVRYLVARTNGMLSDRKSELAVQHGHRRDD
eukprot:TRINITY_DN38614_c0_g1_i1.p1 TRINITY_DN38614_c0_g1~~TRINITY_DN38614_c0_g1_i1.p1  ORF type:complete len:453 (+),score=41.78 TRINITY_DN38614_c0_g1_i1:52-1359(+)